MNATNICRKTAEPCKHNCADESLCYLKLIDKEIEARSRGDRSNIPTHLQSDPHAKAWHWNEHAQGRFEPPKEDE